jgi:hypothetical protein
VLVDQDVSLLVPLDHARSFLPASGAVAAGAPLVARDVFDRLPPLTVIDEPDALYAALSTVAVRLDACFQEGRETQPCRPQVRLVLQPVFDSADGVTTRDCAIHVFFSATEAELVQAVRELAQLRVKQGVQVGAGLTGSHPGFERAAWVDGAKAILSPLLRADHLVRVTSMDVHASNQAWIFSGFDVNAGAFTPIVVATLAPAVETHVTSTGARDTIAITLDPAPVAEPALVTVLQASAREQASPAELSASVDALLRLEDPAAHNPGTVDCASCHVAAAAQWQLANRAPGVPVAAPIPASEVYGDSRAMRAFGYFFQSPALSPRVQRETAAVRADFAHKLEQ